MKIFAVSDTVLESLYHESITERFPDVDLLIGCGDLPFFYLEFLHSALNTSLVYVRGNHDRGPQYTADGRELTRAPGGVDIHGRVWRRNGLLLAGLEGSRRYRPGAPLMYSEEEMRRQIARLLPALLWNRVRYGRFLDILVAHSPPYRIHDQPDLAHTGFRVFRTFMRLFWPRYLLHGHVHINSSVVPRVTRFGPTIVINVFPYCVFDFDTPPRPDAVVATR